jgi:lysophospholipase L1-like esterase
MTPPTFSTLTTLPPLASAITVVPTTTSTTSPTDETPPSVATSPEQGDVVQWFRGEFTVRTEPGSLVTINGEDVELEASGRYAIPITNTPGANLVIVTSTDESDNVTTERVRYDFVPQEGWVAGIGDSVMLGSKIEIEKRLGTGVVDATVSRQFNNAPKLVARLLARPIPPEVIIIGLGTNGPAQERHFEEVMEIAGTDPLVVFVNVHVPRTWEATSNRELAAGVERHDNAVLVDWSAATEGRNNLFAKDGFHPKQPGRVIMAELIASAIFPDWEPLDEE